MVLNPEFLANVSAVDGQIGQEWLRQIDTHLNHLKKKWHLHQILPMTHLTFNFVAIAEMNSGEKAILKMSPPSRPITSEMSWLKSYAPITPKIIGSDESTNSFLMELCQPGTMLKDLLKTETDESVTRKLAEIIRGLRQCKVKEGSFRHISELIPDLKTLKGFANTYLHTKAISLFTDLTQDRSQDILLHADLHHENILDHKGIWKVIDPHGYLGNPTAEVGVMIYNPIGTLPSGPELQNTVDRRLSVLAEELGDDPQKIRAWCFCKTMLSAAWNIPDFQEQARREIEIAEILGKSL